MTELGNDTAAYTVALEGSVDAQVRLAWAAATDTGRRRSSNQDSYVAQSPIFAVADGMGGHSSGDLASALVVERLAEISAVDFVAPREIERALEAASRDISEIAGDVTLGVGTTATGAALTIQSGAAFFAVFNIGDSRVYSLESGALLQLTTDHSVVQELVESGELSAEEAEQHPHSNVITRAVGFNAVPVADFLMLPVTKGLRLLICSDGLTKELGHQQLLEHVAAGRGAPQTVEALIDAALAEGGRDNVTVIIVDVIDAPDPGRHLESVETASA